MNNMIHTMNLNLLISDDLLSDAEDLAASAKEFLATVKGNIKAHNVSSVHSKAFLALAEADVVITANRVQEWQERVNNLRETLGDAAVH